MKEWLSGIVGESAANIVGFVLIFAIILGGIFVVLSIIRRFSGGGFVSNGRTRQPRLSVMDAAAVDSRRKLVLIRRDDVEHLLLIGGPTDVVVEQNIVLESRAHARVQTTRIEPEHIERFRQHEAAIASDASERPALSAQTTAAASEKDEAIQLSSAIETPVYRKPEPPREEPARRQEAPQVAAPRTPPRPPVAPVATPVTPQAPARPVAPTVQARPQPRPAPNYPPQPRTVLPSQPPQAAQPPARSHPAYPLSQVSRGVVSSTSGAAAALATAGAAAATVASANLGSIVPEREPAAAPAVNAVPLDVTSPSVSSTATPEFISTPEPKRAEPDVAFAAPAAEEPAPVQPQPAAAEEDGLESLGGALHDAIMADLDTETASAEGEAQAQEPELSVDFFESELLSSLDISAADDNPSDDIEDEMEKLLGELTRNETRP